MADTRLFSRLKRLFSTDVIIRNQGGNQLRVMDINKIQQSGEYENNSLVDRFNRLYSTSPTSLYGYQSNFNYQTLRPQLYSEYDSMDTDAIIASALDIIADESTLKNDMGEVLQIRSSDENIQKIKKKCNIKNISQIKKNLNCPKKDDIATSKKKVATSRSNSGNPPIYWTTSNDIALSKDQPRSPIIMAYWWWWWPWIAAIGITLGIAAFNDDFPLWLFLFFLLYNYDLVVGRLTLGHDNDFFLRFLLLWFYWNLILRFAVGRFT